MTRRLGIVASLCIAACGGDSSSSGSDESSSSTGGDESSSSSSTTAPMTTSPPTTTVTTMSDESSSSTGEPPCTDPIAQGEFDRYDKLQQEPGAATFFKDIATIDSDRYIVAAAAAIPEDPLAAQLFIINQFETEATLHNEPQEDTVVDRLWVDDAHAQSRVFSQNADGVVEIFDPGDFFNVVGTYQDTESATRLIDVVEADGVMWAVGFVEGVSNKQWLLARSDDLGATWATQEAVQLTAGEDSEAHAIGYHAGAGAVIVGGAASVAGISAWHVRVAVTGDEPAESEELDLVENGNVRTIEIMGDAIVVGGDVDGQWRIRMAPSVGMDFVDLDVGGGFEGGKAQVVDFATGPAGELLALGTVTDENQQTLLTLRMCSDITLGEACWTTLVEPVQEFVGENTFPERLMVDDVGVWMVGTINDIDDDLGPEGFIFRYACPS